MTVCSSCEFKYCDTGLNCFDCMKAHEYTHSFWLANTLQPKRTGTKVKFCQICEIPITSIEHQVCLGESSTKDWLDVMKEIR